MTAGPFRDTASTAAAIIEAHAAIDKMERAARERRTGEHTMQIFGSTLASALAIAIRVQSEQERRAGYDRDSTQVTVWREALDALQRGDRLTTK